MHQYSSQSTLNPSFAGSKVKVSLPVGDSASTTDVHHLEHRFSLHPGDNNAVDVAIFVEKQASKPNTRRTEHNVIYVDFEGADPRNPVNYSRTRKWVITLTACLIIALSAAAGSTYNQGFPTMVPDLHTSEYTATIGLATYSLGCGIAAVTTASLSEEFGRMPLYIISAGGFAATHLLLALAPNVATAIVGRFLNGAFGSIGATMVGGSIADIWSPEEQGFFMAVSSWCSLVSVGVGGAIAAYIEVAPNLGWRWIQWIHCIVTGVYTLLIPILMKETRSDVILIGMARKIRQQTGDSRYRARVEDERPSFWSLLWVCWTRPVYLLFTEPVVASFSLWIGLAWGILFGLIDSLGPILHDLHNFDTTSIGLAFLVLSLGACIGFATSLYQEKLYRFRAAHRGPEARLYTSCAAAVLLPTGMFIFAWCGLPGVPWPALAVGMVLFMWAMFIMYTAVPSYFADVYGPYASSAIASQTCVRNLASTAFPLFITQMNNALGYPWSNTVFAIIAVVLAPVPFVLLFRGPQLRARSKFASQVKH